MHPHHLITVSDLSVISIEYPSKLNLKSPSSVSIYTVFPPSQQSRFSVMLLSLSTVIALVKGLSSKSSSENIFLTNLPALHKHMQSSMLNSESFVPLHYSSSRISNSLSLADKIFQSSRRHMSTMFVPLPRVLTRVINHEFLESALPSINFPLANLTF